MGSISIPTALAAVGATASVAGAINSSNAASQAGSQEAAAGDQASANQLAMFNQVQAGLAPYNTAGQSSLSQLQSLTGTNPGGNPLTAPLTTPFAPTQAQLQATPGYQFTLNQGLESTQNSYAAQGLGSSGAAEKGAANYAEGLASTTYQNQFNNYLAQNQQIYNQLAGISQQGEAAAAGTATAGVQSATQAGNFLTSAGAAQAAGTVGSANALSGGLGTVGSLAELPFLSSLTSGASSGGSGLFASQVGEDPNAASATNPLGF